MSASDEPREPAYGHEVGCPVRAFKQSGYYCICDSIVAQRKSIASDEPRENSRYVVDEPVPLADFEAHAPGDLQMPSDEPRDVPWIVGIDSRVAPEKAAVLAAVLAEVARPPAGIRRPPPKNREEALVQSAGAAIKALLRLKSGGAT